MDRSRATSRCNCRLAVVERLERRGVVEAEPAGDLPGRHPGRGGHEEETDAAVNWKDTAMVVHADDRVDVAAGEQKAPQRGAAVIGREPRGEHETDSPAISRQRDRPLDEQLIAVRVAGR